MQYLWALRTSWADIPTIALQRREHVKIFKRVGLTYHVHILAN